MKYNPIYLPNKQRERNDGSNLANCNLLLIKNVNILHS